MCFINSFFLLWPNVLITIQKLTKKQGYSYFIKLEEFFSAKTFISEIIDILLELKVNEIINFTFHLFKIHKIKKERSTDKCNVNRSALNNSMGISKEFQ